jgi:putative ATPase
MSLLDIASEKQIRLNAPLSERLRPKSIDEFIGQKHILGKGKLLYRAIKADQIQSIILYGPPGTGKTTLAKIISNSTEKMFKQLNAVTSGVKDIRAVVEFAKEQLAFSGKKTILFIDEIHRFNKSQQDALLPYVEKGILVLIGATTENPYYEVNKALISRSMVFKLEPLEYEDMESLIFMALNDERGFKDIKISINEKAKRHLINSSQGDARVLLNALELGVKTTEENKEGIIDISLDIAQECVQKRVIRYEKKGDNHYDTISAFIKSMRGSDADAAVYYLAKMLHAGEDPKFIARRILICASEDVGNADPMALILAQSAFSSVEKIGMPEARIILAQAVLYIAAAPKSNACYKAINEALKDIQRGIDSEVPYHLRDATSNKKSINMNDNSNRKQYLYPHDYKGGYVKQQYLPDSNINAKYYCPKNFGYEKKIKDRIDKMEMIKNET